MEGGEHLLVQAGTGTGKSLGYLVPSLLHGKRVVIATATLALQHQLVERDLPRLVEAVGGTIDTSYAVLKGRSNYACLHRIREGVPDDQGVLVDVPDGVAGRRGHQAARVGRAGEQGRRQRRARQRTAAHRPGLAAGQRQPPRVPRRHQVPVRAGVLRRARQGEGPALAPDRHQPLAARDRRDRGGADDPRLRRGGDRRGPRADRPGHPGGDRRARPPPTSSGRPAAPSATSTASRPTTWPTPARRSPTRSSRTEPGRIDTMGEQLADALVLVRDAARAPASRRSRRSRPATATPTPAAPRPRGSCRRCSSTPSGWPSMPRPTCSGSTRPATASRPGSTWRRSRCGGRCATSCSPTRPWCSPPPP